MARFIIPENFEGRKSFFLAVNEKHTNDAAASVLTNYLSGAKIVMADDAASVAVADTHETNRFLFAGQAGIQHKLRDNNFAQPWQDTIAAVQFLKHENKDNVKELTQWGVPVLVEGKVKYPVGFDARAIIVNAFWAKHASYPLATSPLTLYIKENGLTPAKTLSSVADAITADGAASVSIYQSRQETELRDASFDGVVSNVRGIGNYLMKLYPNNPTKVSSWGFVVETSVQPAVTKIVTVKAGEQKMLQNVKTGGVLYNTGTNELHLYKGKTTTGNPVIVHGGENFTIVRGYGTITVINPSLVGDVKFSVVVNK